MLSTFSGSHDRQNIMAIEIRRAFVRRARCCSRVRSLGSWVVDVRRNVRDRSLMQSLVYTTETMMIGTKYCINIENIE